MQHYVVRLCAVVPGRCKKTFAKTIEARVTVALRYGMIMVALPSQVQGK